MSGPRCPEVGFTSDQEIVQTPKAPHHSSVCIEDQSHTQISLPPLELHDPIAHALEESYIASTRVHDASCLCFFRLLACHSQECAYASTSARSVTQHHDKSTDCMSCTCTHLCSVGTFKLKCVCLHCYIFLVCWFAQLYLERSHLH
jgi:hypothetical protein